MSLAHQYQIILLLQTAVELLYDIYELSAKRSYLIRSYIGIATILFEIYTGIKFTLTS